MNHFKCILLLVILYIYIIIFVTYYQGRQEHGAVGAAALPALKLRGSGGSTVPLVECLRIYRNMCYLDINSGQFKS